MPKWMNEINLLFFILTLTACGGLSGLIGSSDDKVGPSPSVVINSTRVSTVEFRQEMPQTPPSALTPKPPAPAIPSAGSRHFRIEQRSRTDQEAMQDLALVLHSAALSADELSLRVGFENTTTQAFSVIGHFDKSNVVLVDAADNGYEPLRISENLQQISPADGFAPGEANVGNIIFPRPGGPEPYELRLSRFDPIRFRLDTPLPDKALVKVPPGNYPLSVSLRSTQEVLAPIELQVHSVRVETGSLTFWVGFVNTLTQAYGLSVGPAGADAWLRDAEGTRYKPVAVSLSLQASIAPKQGWEPGQEQAGMLTFPEPAAISEVSFNFPGYSQLTIRFDERGVVEARIGSSMDGEVPP